MDQVNINRIKKLAENHECGKEYRVCKVKEHIDAIRICFEIMRQFNNTSIFYRLRLDTPIFIFGKYKVYIKFTRKQYYENRIYSLLQQDHDENASFKRILHDKIKYKFDADILIHNYNLASVSNCTIASERYEDVNDNGKIDYYRVYLL